MGGGRADTTLLSVAPDEIRVLRAEDREVGGGGPMSRLLSTRFGARGHGLLGFRPVGLRAATPERVRAWTAEHFTAGNAIAWFDAPESPPGLRLQLPAGPPHPPPVVPELPRLELPGRVAWRQDTVAVAGVGDVGEALRLAMLCVDRRVTDELRYVRGLVYDVERSWIHLGRGRAHVTLHAAAQEGDRACVREVLLTAITDMAADGPAPDELALARRTLVDGAREEFGDPRADLAGAAEARLVEDPFVPGTRLEAHLLTIDAEEVRAAFATAFATPLLGDDAGDDEPPPAGFAAVELTEAEVPPGDRVPLLPGADAAEGDVLVVGEEALAWVPGDPERRPWAIRYDELVLVDDDPLFGLTFTNPDDASITVCPTDHPGGGELVTRLRERAGSLVVPVLGFATREAIRALAQRRLPPVLMGSNAVSRLSNALEDGEEPLEIARVEDSAGPALLLITDRACLACSLPPEEEDPIRHPRDGITGVEVKRRGRLEIMLPQGKWSLATDGDADARDLSQALGRGARSGP